MTSNELKNSAPAKMKQLVKEINECIKSIQSYIQIDRQEILLMTVTDISNFNNPVLEGDTLFYKQGDLPSRCNG